MSEDTVKNEFKLNKILKELESIKGRHTELVSVYIPSGYSISDVTNQLKDEQGTASNIKSKTTRKNVTTALEKIIQHLRLFKATPPNGLVVFSGNISETEGKEDFELWSFEPPEKMSTKVYWCDQTFVLDPIRDMVKEKDVYGLIVLDARDANVGLLKGKTIQHLKHLDSTVPSKTVKGGMSQHRYDRLREDAIHDFLSEVGEKASAILLKHEMKGLLIGGPGPVKERFAKGKYMHYTLMNQLIGVKDIGYTGEYGLRELVERAADLLKESKIVHERETVTKFFSELQKGGNVTYGLEEVKKALEMGSVDMLLLSEAFDWYRVNYECQCGHQEKLDVRKKMMDNKKCPKCSGWMKPDKAEKVELIDLLTDMAENTGAKVEMISTETTEGMQFKEIGGIGAITRFKIN